LARLIRRYKEGVFRRVGKKKLKNELKNKIHYLIFIKKVGYRSRIREVAGKATAVPGFEKSAWITPGALNGHPEQAPGDGAAAAGPGK